MMNGGIMIECNDPDVLMYGFVVKGKWLRENIYFGFRHFRAYNCGNFLLYFDNTLLGKSTAYGHFNINK